VSTVFSEHGTRCGVLPARVSVPARFFWPFFSDTVRTYLVSTPIIAIYYTELVGDAKVKPTLKASAGFTGIAVIGASSSRV
jgi:glucan 1,3-beta-glucosidase